MAPGEAGSGERAPYAYAVIRVVPRVDRGEFVNVGVVLYSRPRKFLGVRTLLDRERLRVLWPDLDLDAVERHLRIIEQVTSGDPVGGAIAALPAAERFGWLTAPASTVVQPGPVHAGLAASPEAAIEALYRKLVSPGAAAAPEHASPEPPAMDEKERSVRCEPGA